MVDNVPVGAQECVIKWHNAQLDLPNPGKKSPGCHSQTTDAGFVADTIKIGAFRLVVAVINMVDEVGLETAALNWVLVKITSVWVHPAFVIIMWRNKWHLNSCSISNTLARVISPNPQAGASPIWIRRTQAVKLFPMYAISLYILGTWTTSPDPLVQAGTVTCALGTSIWDG